MNGVPASPERAAVNATASRALIEELKKSGVLLQEIAMSGRLRISDATDISAAGLLCEHVAEQLEAAEAERVKLREALERIYDTPHYENDGGVCPPCMAGVALAAFSASGRKDTA